MGKYVVKVCRIAYAFKDIEVEAENETQATDKAMDDAGNHEFSEKDVEYEAQGVTSHWDTR